MFDVKADALLGYLHGTTRAILKQIEWLEYAVAIQEQGQKLAAFNRSERHETQNEDPYLAACKLAVLVGIDLEE